MLTKSTYSEEEVSELLKQRTQDLEIELERLQKRLLFATLPIQQMIKLKNSSS